MSIISNIKSTIGRTYTGVSDILDRVRGNSINVNNMQTATISSQFTGATSPAAPLKAKAIKSKYSSQDFEEIGGTSFGEASDFKNPQVEQEVRAMVSSILNRADVIGKSPREVVAIPNQFLAYGGNQYNKYKARDASEFGSKEKMMIIDRIIQEVKDGNFERQDFTSFNQDPKSGGTKIGNHYFFKEKNFRTK